MLNLLLLQSPFCALLYYLLHYLLFKHKTQSLCSSKPSLFVFFQISKIFIFHLLLMLIQLSVSYPFIPPIFIEHQLCAQQALGIQQ